jgi:peptidoglycan pentaglycine glycine transferase (the first glycine)
MTQAGAERVNSSNSELELSVSETQPEIWNEQIATLPGAHILQTDQWAALKSDFGWLPSYAVWQNQQSRTVAAALILQRNVRFPILTKRLNILYIPKGPLLNWEDEDLARQVVNDLINIGRQRGSIFIKIDPDLVLGKGIPGETDATTNPDGERFLAWMLAQGWRYSDEQIQFRNTVLIDLMQEPDRLLANMKQKTRYNLRLAERKGVQVRIGDSSDIPALYKLYAETSVRDGFVIRSADYYQSVWRRFMEAGMADALIAEAYGEMVAAIIVFRFAKKAWYLYGMSSLKHRNLMPNYLLQWKAFLHAQEQGCQIYDLWGAPDEFNDNDPLWGVYRFKEGFGGTVSRTLGAYDFPIHPFYYALYTRVVPRILDFMRQRGKAQTQRMLTT